MIRRERVGELLSAAILGFLLMTVLLGCATGPFATAPIPVSEKLSPDAQKAQNVINEANVTLTAAANVLAQKKKDGIVTRAQAQSDLNRIKKYGEELDKAQALRDAGAVLDAETQAKAINAALLALRKEIASRKKG